MPLLDDFTLPQRVLSPRQEDEMAAIQSRLAGRDAEPLTPKTFAEKRRRIESTTPSRSLFEDLIGGLKKQGNPIGLDPLTSRIVPLGAGAPMSLDGGRSPQGGTGRYATGRGTPLLRSTAQAVARQMGWNANQFAAWDSLINAESSWNPAADNPTSSAYGLGQFLDSTWKNYGTRTSNPAVQLAYMARYIKDRYGDPTKALDFHRRKNYY